MADRDKMTPEEQKIFDLGFAESAQKADKMRVDFEKMQKEHQEVLRKLTDKDNAIKTTEEEKKSYASRLEELENSGKTEKEKFEITLKRADEANKKALSELEAKEKAWQTRYFDTLKRQALMEAASSADLYNPEQLNMMLSRNVTVEEVKDGENISYVPYITLEGEDGKPIKHKVKDGVTEFLKKNPNLIKSKIIRDENQMPEGIIVNNPDGSVKAIDLSKASVEERNAHFDQIHTALGSQPA